MEPIYIYTCTHQYIYQLHGVHPLLASSDPPYLQYKTYCVVSCGLCGLCMTCFRRCSLNCWWTSFQNLSSLHAAQILDSNSPTAQHFNTGTTSDNLLPTRWDRTNLQAWVKLKLFSYSELYWLTLQRLYTLLCMFVVYIYTTIYIHNLHKLYKKLLQMTTSQDFSRNRSLGQVTQAWAESIFSDLEDD